MSKSKEGMTGIFILSFVIIISSFVSTAIILNELHPSNKITGLAVADVIQKENTTELVQDLFKEEKKPDFEVSVIEVNDSLGLCNITKSDEWITGNCSSADSRFVLQLLVENTGERRISNLKESFFCYDSDKTGFWSLFGHSSEGTIYDQRLNEEPYVAIFEPKNSFIFKLNAERKDIKEEKVNCDVRFFSSETPVQIKKRIFLNFTEIIEETPFDSKTYLNNIVNSIDRNDFRRLNNE